MYDVSIVIPLYNKEKFITRAVNSVLAQTFQNFELIIVDDGSTDRSLEFLTVYGDKRIRIMTQEHLGASCARNRGVMASKSDLIAFLDADDEWMPTFLETIIDLYRTYPGNGAYATSYAVVLPSGKKVFPKFKAIPRFPWSGVLSNYYETVLGELPIISSAIAIPKSTFLEVGGFAEGNHLGEDQDMWFRIAQRFDVVYNNSIEAIYYRGQENSVCADLSILQPYPVIETIKNAWPNQTSNNRKLLEKYLQKLELDFINRLLDANRFDQAHGWLLKCHTKYYKRLKVQLIFKYIWKKFILRL
ncbi:glycosyltransferase family 2 protein [Neobacillus sp. OS1-2]|uniref:glycosyltransferase family 2 protein n=1 Tax=Neobacillus sp. OS1-2 TaxID=3070680 RepID=UPI0027DF11B5|nr:glycosyltransferase family 2 protein [Neobacillus sp. OS1-2]WML39502.1 glycosyltransferase family 2 protein [Neobacillus sp. OS1-2]